MLTIKKNEKFTIIPFLYTQKISIIPFLTYNKSSQKAASFWIALEERRNRNQKKNVFSSQTQENSE